MTNFINELIAGPDPLKGESPFDANSAEATSLFHRVIAHDTRDGKVIHRVRRGAFAGAGIAGVAATVLAFSIGNVGVAAQSAAAASLSKLAANSVNVAPLQGRYVVMSETDTQTGEPGALERTSVIDSQTGAATIYQEATAVNGVAPGTDYTNAPSVLTGAPLSSTEAWFSALPTDTTALKAELLTLGKQQADLPNPVRYTGEGTATISKPSCCVVQPPALSDDDYIYQEADTLLWSALVQPTLRSALYRVLASIDGVSVTQNATDPAGQPAIAMSRTFTSLSETDTTYEDPSTGAVLAQVWNRANGSSVITAVYQPVTSANVAPSNPYGS
jgi:hypothetical protein